MGTPKHTLNANESYGGSFLGLCIPCISLRYAL
jgi:hypothetical protein